MTGSVCTQPGRLLQVLDSRDALEQPVVLITLELQLSLDVRFIANRSTQNDDALLLWRERPTPYPDSVASFLLQIGNVPRLLACCIPNIPLLRKLNPPRCNHFHPKPSPLQSFLALSGKPPPCNHFSALAQTPYFGSRMWVWVAMYRSHVRCVSGVLGGGF